MGKIGFTVVLTLCVTFEGAAQWIHAGVRLNVDVAEKLNSGTKEYHFATFTPYDATIGNIEVTSAPSVEAFVRYDHFDRMFFQAGFTGFKNKYKIEFITNGEGTGPDVIEAVFAQNYVTIGKIFSGSSVIKPYITGGLALTYKLDYSNAHTYDNGSDEWIRDEIIVRDLQQTFSDVTLLGRVGAGLKFYALHAEFTVSRNITKLDNSGDNYYQSWLIPQISVGYNLITFNTVAKAKH